MENTIILNSGAKLDVVMQDNVTLDIDCALRYIKSGHQEIADYVNTQAKPHLQEVITLAQTQMNNAISQGVTDAAQAAEEMTVRTIEASISTAEDAISAYVTSDITPSLNSLLTQATAAANTATQTVSGFEAVCEAKISDFNANATTKQNAVNVAAQNAENSAITANSAATSAQNSAASASQSAALIDSVIANAKDEISAELNNPFSLLDCKYSEYEISNASWLLSNGQWNSGAVYQSVYDLLLQIYNGTVTKAGVSVKLSTEAYADTDFVLNTTDTTFRLPLYTQRVLVKKYVNGTEWYNLYSDGWCEQGGFVATGTAPTTVTLLKEMADINYYANAMTNTSRTNPQNYDKIIQGKTTTSITVNQFSNWFDTFDWQVCGYCNPSSVSEYTEIKGLYFYVGETVQDANIIAAGQALTDIADLKNASNFSSLGKETIAGWGMPDYTTGVNVPLTGITSFVAPYDCEVCYMSGLQNTALERLSVNGEIVAVQQGSNAWVRSTVFLKMSKGDILAGLISNDVNRDSALTYYKLKGVN